MQVYCLKTYKFNLKFIASPLIFNIHTFVASNLFSYMASERQCLSVMSIVGIGLLIINLIAMYKLKDHVEYDI